MEISNILFIIEGGGGGVLRYASGVHLSAVWKKQYSFNE